MSVSTTRRVLTSNSLAPTACAWVASWKRALSSPTSQASTSEPGIYFIPALIDEWKASGHCKEFLCFDKIETYKDFGGIRIEDDVLITRDGCRFLGDKRIPYHVKELEAFMASNISK